MLDDPARGALHELLPDLEHAVSVSLTIHYGPDKNSLGRSMAPDNLRALAQRLEKDRCAHCDSSPTRRFCERHWGDAVTTQIRENVLLYAIGGDAHDDAGGTMYIPEENKDQEPRIALGTPQPDGADVATEGEDARDLSDARIRLREEMKEITDPIRESGRLTGDDYATRINADTPASSPSPPPRCQAMDEDGFQCLAMEGHEGEHCTTADLP